MQIPVFVERIKGNGYRARGTQPFAITTRGATRDEALNKLRAKIQNRLKNGMELIGLEVGSETNPWVEFAGMFKDDPMMDEWKQAMADYRNKVEEDTDSL